MKTNKQILLVSVILMAIFFVGCTELQQPMGIAPQNEPSIPQSTASAARFQDPVAKENTAVDSAVKLAQEYSLLSDENSQLKQKIQDLNNENVQLKKQVSVLEPELQQTKKELNQANDLLVDMTTELNNWKVQVLGFQDQMRDANKAQMQMLLKIAQAMGAEVPADQQPSEKLTTTSGEQK